MSLKKKLEDVNIINPRTGNIKKCVSSNSWISNNGMEKIIDDIYQATAFLHKEYTLMERIHAIRLDITEQPICELCGTDDILFNKQQKHFRNYCSVKCSANSAITKKLRQQTCLKKYGVTHHLKKSDIMDKQKKTNIKRYGKENISQIPEFKKRILKTNTEKFNWWYRDKNLLKAELDKFNNDVLSLSHYYGISNATIYRKVKEFGILEKSKIGSFTERAISEFLTKNNISHTQNTRKIIAPLELDIYIPEKNIAIEYNGLYWHNSERVDKNYHLNKTKACADKGIQLIHIFENEWISNPDIVKSRLLNLLGKTPTKIFARKCTIKEISCRESKVFLEDNHIQGGSNSPINYGLFHKDELVSIMTFSKTRFSKKYEYELVRFCNKKYSSVTGGASKLLAHFKKEHSPKSIVSYSCKRWSNGNLYKQLGFTYSHTSSPNYWYFKDTYTLESRIKYQKHKLGKLLETFDPKLTEYQNMEINGYLKIYDCGNDVWIL